MAKDTKKITEKQVITYLQENKEFALNNGELFDLGQVDNSASGVVSLSQYHNQKLKQKNEQLQKQLQNIIDTARENTALQTRIHGLCLALLDTKNLDDLLPLLMGRLKNEFGADEVAFRLFYDDKPLSLSVTTENVEQLAYHGTGLHVFKSLLVKKQVVCGRLTQAQKEVLFADKVDRVVSFACLPLGEDPAIGLLAIASEDANRFHSDMATDYLCFLGEIITRLLQSYVSTNGE